MAINLKDHILYVEDIKMDMVPFREAEKAIQEALEAARHKQLDDAINILSREITSIKPDFKIEDD